MAARKEIQENDLLEYSRCLYRGPEQFPYLDPIDTLVAEATARTFFLEAFEQEELLSAARAREHYERAWKTICGKQGKMDMSFEAAIAVSKRLSALLTRYEIVQPVTKYVLNLGKALIAGEFAVLTERKGRKKPLLILRLRHKAEGVIPRAQQRPDLVSYARWLYLRHVEPNELDMQVLNYALQGKESWTDALVLEKPIRGALTSMVELVLNKTGFPSPGDHCRSCHTNGCAQDTAAHKISAEELLKVSA
jgi:hypothetical protein